MRSGLPTWRELLGDASSALDSPLEGRRLIEEVAGLDAAGLALALDRQVDRDAPARLEHLVDRRRSGEPLQHVLGHWSFRTLELALDARALIPRPETEIVVGRALAELEGRRSALARASRRSAPPELLALDLGTGSGAIACALVAETEDVRVVAVDRSPSALELASLNRSVLERSAAGRLELVEGDWFGGVAEELWGAVDCIVANPPYVAEHEWAALDPVVRDYDPYSALVAGPTGLESIREIVRTAPDVLADGGALVVEIAPTQALDVLRLASDAGARFAEIARDLAGRDRMLVARWGGMSRDGGSRP